MALGEAWLELDAGLGILTRLLVAAQLKEAGSAVRVDRVLRLVEGDGLRVVHGRLLVVVLLEGLVALVLTEDDARGVAALVRLG